MIRRMEGTPARIAAARIVPLLAMLLTACAGDGYGDLREFMKKTEASLPHHIDPLPAAKVYEPFEYDGFALPDPFRPRALRAEGATPTGLNAPDTKRNRDVLERFPLDALRLVGVLQQQGRIFALIKADGTLYRVKTGDHLGLDYGTVTAISETEVALHETVQDAAGEWTLRQAKLQLVEGAQEIRK